MFEVYILTLVLRTRKRFLKKMNNERPLKYSNLQSTSLH